MVYFRQERGIIMGQAVFEGRPYRPQLSLGAYDKKIGEMIGKASVSPIELAMEIGQSLFIAIYRKRSYRVSRDREYFFSAIFNDQIIRQCRPSKLFIQVFTPDYVTRDVLALRSLREKNTLFALLPEKPDDYRGEYFKALQIRSFLHSRDPKNIPDYIRTYPAKVQEARKHLSQGDVYLRNALTHVRFYADGKEMKPSGRDPVACLDEGLEWFIGMRK